jgi:hypothetical protein
MAALARALVEAGHPVLFTPSHDAWLLLEADPTVQAFSERPAYVEG